MICKRLNGMSLFLEQFLCAAMSFKQNMVCSSQNTPNVKKKKKQGTPTFTVIKKDNKRHTSIFRLSIFRKHLSFFSFMIFKDEIPRCH